MQEVQEVRGPARVPVAGGLRQNLQSWDGLLETLPIAVYICDRDGIIVQYNQRATELWGRAPARGESEERFCGAHRLWWPDGRLMQHAETPMADVLRTGVPVRDQEVTIERPDGSRIAVLASIDPLVDEKGRPVGAVNCFQDITERKRVEDALREQDQRLAATYEQATVGISEADAQGRLLRVNEASCRLTGRSREELLNGPPFFERMLPEDIDAERELYRRQIDGELDHYAVEKRIRRKDGNLIWVSVSSSSVRGPDGRFRYAVRVIQDITERMRAEERLRASERWLRGLLDSIPAAIYTTDANGRITYYNQAAVELAGLEPDLGSADWCVSWRLYNADGTPLPHDQCPMAVALREYRPIRDAEAIAERPDGTRVPFIPYPTPLFDESGNLIGAINMLVDVTERKQSEMRLKALIHELNHRVKNTLATVQSLARQSAQGATSPHVYAERLEGRLIALSRAHDQLTHRNWEHADLRAILTAGLSPYQSETGEQVTLDGDAVYLSPRAALTLAMVFHELTTNAAKYGSLSQPSGRLDISWKREWNGDGSALRLSWRETGGPPVEPPKRGFGTHLVEQSLRAEFGGTVDLRFEPSGVCCDIEVPLAKVT